MISDLQPRLIEVRAAPGAIHGALAVGGLAFDCALGRAGILAGKREGDDGTPAGRWALREVFWRPDRGARPATGLPVSPLAPDDAWCDDPGHPAYNRRVRLPFAAGHEVLWRADALYDLVAVIGYNDAPPVADAGSAIFLHVAAEGATGFQSTAGCVALREPDLRAVLAICAPETRIDIAVA
jgi:L,D-peptidoglycan transpeptidase YkuD (ErfK/YbiS/YcfS/YnhG family)